MTTLLDLIQEWASLNEAKTITGGVLPAPDESRWHELRDFYQLLMNQQGLSAHPVGRYSEREIRQTVAARSRLRVHAEIDTIAVSRSDAHAVRIGNLSCGGVLLLTEAGWGSGTPILVHLSALSKRVVFHPRGRVVWSVDSGSKHGTFRYRIGVEFLELGPREQTSLDDCVVNGLETKLRSLSRDALDREFVRREGLTV